MGSLSNIQSILKHLVNKKNSYYKNSTQLYFGECGNIMLYMDDLKAKFALKYANLPEGSRDEIIAVIKSEPYTWRSARIEIDNNTVIGTEILEFLSKLEIIQ